MLGITDAMVHMWRAGDNFVKLVISFHLDVILGTELRLSGLSCSVFTH